MMNQASDPYMNMYGNYQYPPLPPSFQSRTDGYQSIRSQLYGRVVDNKEMVKVIDIPVGTYGVFPKTDLSEIYIKYWNKEGNTEYATFQLKEETQEKDTSSNNTQAILEGIKRLEDKLNSLNVVAAPVQQSNSVNL